AGGVVGGGLVGRWAERGGVKSRLSGKENFGLPAFVTPCFSLGSRLNLLPPPLFALPFSFRTKVWVAPPTSIVTGRPLSEIPAPMVIVPFQLTLSVFAFSKSSAIVAFFVTGDVTDAKFTISPSSAWVRHVIAFAGNVTRFLTVFLALFLLPCTVTNVITIAEAPGSRDRV